MRIHSAAVTTRWIARTWSILSLLFVSAFFLGEVLSGAGPKPTPIELVGLLLWPIGVTAGLVVAWFHEALGGLLATGFLIAFCLWNVLVSGRMPQSLFFYFIAAPALIFLLAAFLSRPKATPAV